MYKKELKSCYKIFIIKKKSLVFDYSKESGKLFNSLTTGKI